MGTPSSAPLGVLGRYALHAEIAAGGMATVHFGRLMGAEGFSRTVAIKRLHPQFAKDPGFAKMFLQEARLASRIRHPNVVPTVDVVATDGELFLVMEYVQGESLARLYAATSQIGAALPYTFAVTIMAGVLHGLHAAHEATGDDGTPLGLVHRDVSPQNILVGADGVPRVLDFGVAKAANRTNTTGEGNIKGKISYMALEQIEGANVDRRTDVYAASIVLWECLTGQRLFDGEHQAQTIMKVMEGHVPPPSSITKGIPPALDAIVLKGLTREQNGRYQTAREMARALEKLGSVPASEIGEWVERVAGPELEERASRLGRIESSSDRFATSLAAPPVPDLAGTPPSSRAPVWGGGMTPATTSLAAPTPSPAKRWMIGAALVAMLGVLVAIGLVVRGQGRPGVATGTASATSTPILDPPPPSLDDPNAAVPSPPPTMHGAAGASASGAPSARPKGVPIPQPPRPKAGCNPPYTIDADGNRKYKRECL